MKKAEPDTMTLVKLKVVTDWTKAVTLAPVRPVVVHPATTASLKADCLPESKEAAL